MLFLAVGILGISTAGFCAHLDSDDLIIFSYMDISSMNVLKNAFSDAHQLLTNFSEDKYVCIIVFLLLSNLSCTEKSTLQLNDFCHTPWIFFFLLHVSS